ncbi:MAG: hypothetical protein IIX86_05110 [Clostridia bacterium]|nr:hypothetical protein [Clostridia bacterium]
MHEQDKKVILTREGIVAQHQRDLLVELLKTIVAEGFLIALSVLVTFNLVNTWYECTWFVRIVLLLMVPLLWFIAVLVAITIVQTAIRLMYMKNGKYTIEIDRVGLLKLKTEEEYVHSPGSRNGHTEIVTNQYVYFEKYGMVKSNRPLANGQECYLLVVQTKKPHVRGFWECDIHEITGI